MNRNALRSLCRGLSRTAVIAVVAVVSMGAWGCADNALPPVPVPKAEMKSTLPRWYPEKEWTAKEGQSQIYIEGKVVFDTGSDRIQWVASEKVLKTLLAFLGDHPEVTRLRIEGHTDSMGDDEANQQLSAKRALAVCNWLVDHQISNLRLIAVGFGKTKPIAPNELAEGRAENRRVEFHVAEVDGRPFMGRDPTGGGMVLDVPSLEERKLEEERKKHPPVGVVPTLKFKATGNEVKKYTPVQKGPENAPDDKPTAPMAPVGPDTDEKKDGGKKK